MPETERRSTAEQDPVGAPASENGRAEPTAPGFLGRLHGLRLALARATVDNPVLVKEFRTRMRGARAYWLLLAYTLLLAGVVGFMYFSYEASLAQQDMYRLNSQGAQDLGRWIYWLTFIAQAVMVALITPAITAGTVTIEREQRSYELLVTTPLRPVDIVRGKLSAAVSFVVLLLTASLPLVSLSFLVGGVSPAEIFFSYLIVALCAGLYGAIGIFWSSALRSTAIATVVAYLTVLSLFLVTLIIAIAPGSGSGPGGQPGFPFQSVNPIGAVYHGVQAEYFFAAKIPGWVGAAVLNLLLGLLIAIVSMDRLEHFEAPRPFWTRFISTLLWCSFGLFCFGPILGGVLAGATVTAGPMRENVATTVGVMLAFAVLVTPIFNTGDLIVRRGESALGRYLSGFSPHRIFAADLSCGLPLVLGWTLFMLALMPAAAHFCGKGASLNGAGSFLPAAAVCLAVVFGLAGIGNLLSVTLPSRWAACILTYLAAVVLILLPWFPEQFWQPAAGALAQSRIEPIYQVLYLTPIDALAQLGNPGSFWVHHPPLMLGRGVPLWQVNVAIFAAIGLVGFLLTALRVSHEGKLLQARMEATERELERP